MRFGRHPSELDLMMLHDGELDTERAAAVATHAEGCKRCASWLADLDHVGAVVRGDVVPPPVERTPRTTPVLSRVIPAVAAVAALVLGVVFVGSDDPPRDEVVAGTANVEDVPLPTSIPPATSEATGPDRAAEPPGAATTVPDPQPGAGATDPGDDIADTATSSPVITVGVMIPGGLTGPDEPVAHAVAAALAQANDDADEGAPRFELAVVDGSHPRAAAAVADRRIDVMVGGRARDADTYAAITESGVPWIGPADALPGLIPGVITIELAHDEAGRRVASQLAELGHTRAAAITDSTAAERRLVDGLAQAFEVTTTTKPGKGCRAGLEAAALSGADVLVMGLPPALVEQCLRALPDGYPVRQIVIPSTALDVARPALPNGIGMLAALGAPLPDGAGAGPERFREVTGLRAGYGALVSFAGAELLAELVHIDPADPLDALMKGGLYRSDLLTLDPSIRPMNVAVQVVQLGSPEPAASPNSGESFGSAA